MQRFEHEKVYWNYLRQGNNEGLYGLYRLFYTHLYHYGINLTGDDDLVKDTIQNVFLYFWEKREALSAAEHVKRYILTSFRRSLLETVKKRNSQVMVELDGLNAIDIEGDGSVEDSLIRDQNQQRIIQRLSQAISKLPPRQQEMIYLKYYQNLSYEEIAKKTNTNIRTVYNQIHGAVKTLRANKNLASDSDLLLIIFLHFAIWKISN